MSETTLVVCILQELSLELGFELLIEPEYGYAGRIKTKRGKVLYFHGTHFDINPLGASEIATDKAYASYFMNELGYPTPEGKSFYSDEWCKKIRSKRDTIAAVRYANTLGYPVIVKPNSRSQGQGVTKVYSDNELTHALRYIFRVLGDKVALVQRALEGNDYRIVVLGNEVLCAYRRIPLSVQGDGKSSISQLLQKQQELFIKKGRETTIAIEDPRIKNTLMRAQLDFGTIVSEGAVVQLLDNANLSSGGEAEDVTSVLHPEYKQIAIRLAQDMALKFCGIDLMTTHPIHEKLQHYTIIEINSAPGLDYYAGGGETQKAIVKRLYRKLLEHMIYV